MRRQQPPTPDAAGTSRDPFSLLSAPIGCAYDNVVRAADMAGTGMKASSAPLRLLASDAAQLGATGIADGGRWAGRGIYSGIRFIGLRCLRDTYEVYALQELEHIPAAAAVVPLTAGHGTALEARRQRHGVIQFMVCRKTPSLRSAARQAGSARA